MKQKKEEGYIEREEMKKYVDEFCTVYLLLVSADFLLVINWGSANLNGYSTIQIISLIL